MAIAIFIPRLGWNMDEGVFAGWLKSDGSPVRSGEPLFSLETEKATEDIEASDDGILQIEPDAPNVGDRVPVGAVIGHLVQPGAAPVPTHSRPDRLKASPLARRIARDLNIDWTTLRGSGRTGRIRKADVLAAAPVELPHVPSRSTPISPIRRSIAARMTESRQSTAPVTLTTTIDATNLVNLRGQFKVMDPSNPLSYTDFLIKLTALALKSHPQLQSQWQGDRIIHPEDSAIGIAVDTAAGLLVPVIHNPAGLGLRQLASQSRDLIQRARSGTLKANEMQGGTFTITNLGPFGIETFTPIINPPEAAILGIGRIARQAVMIGDQAVGRDRMSLSLTFDHRLIDGAPAARFLQGLGQMIENPGPWLIG